MWKEFLHFLGYFYLFSNCFKTVTDKGSSFPLTQKIIVLSPVFALSKIISEKILLMILVKCYKQVRFLKY